MNDSGVLAHPDVTESEASLISNALSVPLMVGTVCLDHHTSELDALPLTSRFSLELVLPDPSLIELKTLRLI